MKVKERTKLFSFHVFSSIIHVEITYTFKALHVFLKYNRHLRTTCFIRSSYYTRKLDHIRKDKFHLDRICVGKECSLQLGY